MASLVANIECVRQAYTLDNILEGAVDHVALKAANRSDYSSCIQELLPISVSASYITRRGRRLATLELDRSITVGAFGSTTLIEVLEPRCDGTLEAIGLEHIEIWSEDLEATRLILDHKQVPYTTRVYPLHTTLVVRLNPAGQELKYTDRGLREVVVIQVGSGEATVLK
jgi:hypothetical protein